jgi:hypothetical protein
MHIKITQWQCAERLKDAVTSGLGESEPLGAGKALCFLLLVIAVPCLKTHLTLEPSALVFIGT